MRRNRYVGIVFLVVGLAFAWSVINGILAWRRIGYPSFWGELVAAITGIVIGVYALISSR